MQGEQRWDETSTVEFGTLVNLHLWVWDFDEFISIVRVRNGFTVGRQMPVAIDCMQRLVNRRTGRGVAIYNIYVRMSEPSASMAP